MRIFRPADVVAMADQVRGGLAEGADQVKELLELVPRVVTLVQRAEFLLDSAERTLARTETMVARGEAMVERGEAIVERGKALLEGVEEVAPNALPILGQVIEAIDPKEVRAFNGLVDQLPTFLEQLKDVGPNVSLILESVTDLSQAIKGFPGMGALIRRGERKDEEEAAEEVERDLAELRDSGR